MQPIDDNNQQKIEIVNAESGEPCVELYYKEAANTLGIKVRQKTTLEAQQIFDELYTKYGHLTGKPKEAKAKGDAPF